MSGDGTQGGHAGRSVGGGRYVLGDLLGQGGMASVHLAHDTVLDRPVAVKTLHTNLGNEQSFRERFRREAQAVAKLNHTNIVSVFDSGEDTIDGALVPYIVMEYVEGKPLGTVLAEDVAQYGAMPADKALKITGDVLAALAVSHEMGLVHRDIKPGNVMVTKRGVVKVMDFGIARAMQSGVTSMTQTGMVVGTPQYLSPEQALGRGVDERSDLYSVGCMLFELLTGRLPFEADSPLAMAYQHVQQMPPAPSQFNRAVPPGVDALVARALRKNPAERFPTADAMHDEGDRVAASVLGGTAPQITGGAAYAHGRGKGVASAVFPPAQADPHTPPPNVHTPYQASQQGGWGPSTPAPTPQAPSYGYPQQPQHSTPAPAYTMRPAPQGGGTGSGGGGGGLSTAAIAIGSTVAVVAIALVVIIAIAMNKGDGTDNAGGDNPTSSPSQAVGSGRTSAATDNGGGIKQGDKDRTVEMRTCTDPTQGFVEKNPDVYIMPDLKFKYIDSVKACMDAAKWNYDIKYQDEQVWGKGTVISQTPEGLSDFNPKKDKVTVYVSTGKTSS